MKILNPTRLCCDVFVGPSTSGWGAVVLAKATLRLPLAGERWKYAREQHPLVAEDIVLGESGFTPTVYESDYHPPKHRCDFTMYGHAYADGPSCRRRLVGVTFGKLSKQFAVTGTRYWMRGLAGFELTEPEPFLKVAVHYGAAFGGWDDTAAPPDGYLANPFGRGYLPRGLGRIEGRAGPQTEEVDAPISSPTANYRPMALGPIARGTAERSAFAGHANAETVIASANGLPADFDWRHFQHAPADQQCPFPTGSETLKLIGLTDPAVYGVDRYECQLPSLDLRVEVAYRARDPQACVMNVDTVAVVPDRRELILVWRGQTPLRRRSLDEIELVEFLAPESPQAGPHSLKEQALARSARRFDTITGLGVEA